MSRESLSPDSVRKNLRVEYRPSRGSARIGLLTGQRTSHGSTFLVEVFPEGSSKVRTEDWEIQRVFPLPPQQQLVALGGTFQPPVGYPFLTKPTTT